MNLPVHFFAAAEQTRLLFIWDQATLEAKVIIIFLIGFSIAAWSVMGAKAAQMRRARKLNGLFEAEFRAQGTVFDIFDRRVQVEGCSLLTVYQDGYAELDARLKVPGEGGRRPQSTLKAMEHVKRVMERAVAQESLKLESGLIFTRNGDIFRLGVPPQMLRECPERSGPAFGPGQERYMSPFSVRR